MISAPGQIIALNAALSYVRALAALALGLFASRWVLQALGTSDFGITVTIGAIVAFGTFAGDMLRFSVLRHLAFAVGTDETDAKNAWMRAACAAHLMLACIAAAILWPAGEWAVRSLVRIPPERLSAALVMFRCSLTMLFITIATVPFCAIFTAHQRFATPSVINTVRSLWMFAWAFWLTRSPGDRLSSYAMYSLAGLAVAQAAIIVCSYVRFGSMQWKHGVDWRKVRDITSFAGWNVSGGCGFLIATQGTAFVTNGFFGTVGNAAYGVAVQVQIHAEALANSLTGAFAPAVTSRQGSGDEIGMRRLAGRAGLFAPLLTAFFVIPLVAEMQTVLEIWLDTPPPAAAPVCSIMLLAGIFSKLTLGQQLAITADGRIAKWQVVIGIGQSLALPLSIALAISGCGVISAAMAYALSLSVCFLANLHYGSKNVGVRLREWASEVAVPFSAIMPPAVFAALLPRLWMDAGIPRVLTVSAASSLVFATAFFILAFKWKRSK